MPAPAIAVATRRMILLAAFAFLVTWWPRWRRSCPPADLCQHVAAVFAGELAGAVGVNEHGLLLPVRAGGLFHPALIRQAPAANSSTSPSVSRQCVLGRDGAAI